MTDPLHGGELVKHHTGNLSLELKHPDGRKETMENFMPLAEKPGFYEATLKLTVVGNYECMVQYNAFDIQPAPAKLIMKKSTWDSLFSW